MVVSFNYTEEEAAEPAGLRIGLTLPILILGTVGNILTLCVLSRGAFRHRTVAVFLRALAVADLFVVWLDPLTLTLLNPAFPSSTPRVACTLYAWAFAAVSAASSWTLVLVTLQRLVIVTRPHLATLLVTERRATLAVVTVWLAFVALGSCTLAPGHPWRQNCALTALLTLPELLTFTALYSVAPALTLSACNVAIAVTVRRATRTRRSFTARRAEGSGAGTAAGRADRLTLMLVTNSVAFVVLTLPEVLVYTVELAGDTRVPDGVVWAVNALRRLNHAVNFVLYCVSGALFRRQLALLVSDALGWVGLGWRRVGGGKGAEGRRRGYRDVPTGAEDVVDGPMTTVTTSTTAVSTSM